MDLTTLIGLIVGLGSLILGFLLQGGNIGMLLVETALIIVVGGTIGATIICFTPQDFKKLPHYLKVIFTDKKIDYYLVLETLVETADKARRGGLLSLENQLGKVDNEFLGRGLQLVIDGADPQLTRSLLEMEIEAYEKEEKVGADMFMTAGGFAPTMGIIGTVMGMVNVLNNLSHPDALGSAIAACFLAILYGIFSANVFWIPFGTKIKVKAGREVLLMELILEGILSIQAGENPRVIREKLMTLLPADAKIKGMEYEQARMEI